MIFVKSLFLAAITSLFIISPSFAQSYGQGDYGACLYGEGCADPSPDTGGGTTPSNNASGGGSNEENTVVETPDGLEVSINLTNGQKLPATGYRVIVTPLNGQGESFKYVEFVLDGKLIATVEPDSTGTAYWFWDTAKYKGTKLEVIVYDQDGTATTKTFNVTIAEVTTNPKPTTTSSEQDFFEKVFGYMAENPWTWGVVILVPGLLWLIIFLIRRRKSPPPTSWQS